MQSSTKNSNHASLPDETSIVERRTQLWSAYERYLHEPTTTEILEEVVNRYTPSLFKESDQQTSLGSLRDAISTLIAKEADSK